MEVMSNTDNNTPIAGIKSILTFLRSLRRHNDRIWFNEHKDSYLNVKDHVEILTGRLIQAISEFDPDVTRLRPSDCLYRIYRDTRFSPDKTPYKTHIGIYICAGGKKSPLAGYYLHLAPDNCLMAGGAWCPETPYLKRIRQDIYDNVEEYLEIIENPEFKKTFPVVGEDLLKTAPREYPKDWEYISLLKPRSFTVYSAISDEEITGPDAFPGIVERMRIVKPYNDFINYSIEEVNVK